MPIEAVDNIFMAIRMRGAYSNSVRPLHISATEIYWVRDCWMSEWRDGCRKGVDGGGTHLGRKSDEKELFGWHESDIIRLLSKQTTCYHPIYQRCVLSSKHTYTHTHTTSDSPFAHSKNDYFRGFIIICYRFFICRSDKTHWIKYVERICVPKRTHHVLLVGSFRFSRMERNCVIAIYTLHAVAGHWLHFALKQACEHVCAYDDFTVERDENLLETESRPLNMNIRHLRLRSHKRIILENIFQNMYFAPPFRSGSFYFHFDISSSNMSSLKWNHLARANDKHASLPFSFQRWLLLLLLPLLRLFLPLLRLPGILISLSHTQNTYYELYCTLSFMRLLYAEWRWQWWLVIGGAGDCCRVHAFHTMCI